MNISNIHVIRDAIRRSFQALADDDGPLFEMPPEEGSSDEGRKLHEVCINHQLARHLQTHFLPLLDNSQRMYVDIEFNREGTHFKNVTVGGQEKTVRTDIIIHNRQSGEDKCNVLIVECKKSGADQPEIQKDVSKINALMVDDRYSYCLGLQVTYDRLSVKGRMFYKLNSSITEEPIEVKPSSHRSAL